jgi:hypothetical protein
LAGWLWILSWAAILWLIVSPWRELGGVVSERWRWLEWLVLGWCPVLGCHVASIGRRRARFGSGLSHARMLRMVLVPPAALTAAALLVLRCLENEEAVGVLVTGFLAYWAGLDLALGGWPLAQGDPYSFLGPLTPPRRLSACEGDPQDPAPGPGA